MAMIAGSGACRTSNASLWKSTSSAASTAIAVRRSASANRPVCAATMRAASSKGIGRICGGA
jgi:hypothetical protein